MIPEYEKLAQLAQDKQAELSLVIAKVDATENKLSAEEYGIEGFPTLKLFINGRAVDFKGGRTA